MYHTLKSTQNNHGNQSVMAGFDLVVLLYYFPSQVFTCASYICFPEHKESLGPVHWLFGHSTLSTAAAMSRQKILLGLGSERAQGSGSFCKPLALFFQGLAHPGEEVGGCLERRLGVVSIALCYLGCSNSSDAVGSCVLLILPVFGLTVPEELRVGCERQVAREGQTQIPILLS